MIEWFGIMLDASRIAFEAQEVIALRLEKLARGDANASVEATAMFTEKAVAAGEAWLAASSVAFSSGGDPRRTAAAFMKPYGKRVRANRRRLTR